MGSSGRLCALLCLLGSTVLFIQACHHQKENQEQFTPGTAGRKRRAVQNDKEVILSIFSSGPTPYPRSTNIISPTIPTVFRDRDAKLSKFFTDCMKRKTGDFFQSWTSVIDFILRDTNWYSATDRQFCPENKDKDDGAVNCWQRRLTTLLKNKSELLKSGKQCIADFDRSHTSGAGSTPQRKKRTIETENILGSIRTGSSTPPATCPAVPNALYSACVGAGVSSPSNIAKFPSLREFDPQSVEKFVTEQFTNCRIDTIQASPFIKTYREVCPPKSAPSKNNCYILTLTEIITESSPLLSIATSCVVRLISALDKCRDVICNLNSYCDPNVGACTCNIGYTSNNNGSCESDPCLYTTCEGSKYCRKNLITNRAECICKNGLPEVNGVCTIRNPCSNTNCQVNSICYAHRGQGYCICDSGYYLSAPNSCTVKPICEGVLCGNNSYCDMNTGRCICNQNYNFVSNVCVYIGNPCILLLCPERKICQINQQTGQGECVCKSGYIQRSSGKCVVANSPCRQIKCRGNKSCRLNKNTRQGECVCKKRYNQLTNGRCVSCPATKRFEDCPTACPKTCNDQNPSFCIEVCPIDKYCVCREGMVQLTSDINSPCVVPSRCPVINPCSTTICQNNEVCQVNPEIGFGECVCIGGYNRLSNGTCVTCPASKRFKICPTACPKTCNDPNPSFCTAICSFSKYCECAEGTVQLTSDDNSRCVRPSECPAICRNDFCPRNSRCIGGKCTCNSGYRMDNSGRRCIVLSRCPKWKVYNLCPTICTATCENQKQEGFRFCPPGCRPNVQCVCQQGMVERSNIDNRCVFPRQCKGGGATEQCKGVLCTGNKICRLDGQGKAICICPSGQTDYDGVCFTSNVCQFISCEINKICKPDPTTGSAVCVCKEGLATTPTGDCQAGTCNDKTQCTFLSCINIPMAIRDCRKTCGLCLFASLGR